MRKNIAFSIVCFAGLLISSVSAGNSSSTAASILLKDARQVYYRAEDLKFSDYYLRNGISDPSDINFYLAAEEFSTICQSFLNLMNENKRHNLPAAFDRIVQNFSRLENAYTATIRFKDISLDKLRKSVNEARLQINTSSLDLSAAPGPSMVPPLGRASIDVKAVDVKAFIKIEGSSLILLPPPMSDSSAVLNNSSSIITGNYPSTGSVDTKITFISDVECLVGFHHLDQSSATIEVRHPRRGKGNCLIDVTWYPRTGS